ncbi:helix-turn-helix domain-containing protein [Amycolatopsis rhabdoformis]|uniref:Helix-turn-helix domain-containing protein n=1 Tax=Amycolatopsis rhabdoformis TaxID=1448059 RepID=A0ABZ1I6K2_9PSEU|nr:helix-turn-helix domain-containing protein [Amycolatopsis rhabdoformis]WSE30059.1 helix-turn-helix domain-containing protein [Amycolatopsis rhabdoformis]
MTRREATSGPDPELVALAGRLLGTIEEFADEIASAIETRVEFYGTHTVVPADDLRHSVQGNLEYVLRSLHEDRYADVAAARTTGALRAEQGVPLSVVMAAFRVLFSQIWHSLVLHARTREQVSDQALVDAASDLWSAHDTFAEEMAAAHRETTMALVLRNEGERSALVGALLEGRPLHETSVWEVADVLRLPKRGPFVVVAAESVQLAQEALPGIENRLRTRRIGSAWRLTPDAQIGIVRFENDADLRPLASTLTESARSRIGVSPPYLALTETAAALRFARIALASTVAGSPRVTMFDDFPLAVAAVSAPDAMARVRQAVLGPILDLPAEHSKVLLETLAAWRDSGGSASEAAAVLFCHPNTVRHRLRRIEAATGRSLSDPKATAEILIALEAALLGIAQ